MSIQGGYRASDVISKLELALRSTRPPTPNPRRIAQPMPGAQNPGHLPGGGPPLGGGSTPLQPCSSTKAAQRTQGAKCALLVRSLRWAVLSAVFVPLAAQQVVKVNKCSGSQDSQLFGGCLVANIGTESRSRGLPTPNFTWVYLRYPAVVWRLFCS